MLLKNEAWLVSSLYGPRTGCRVGRTAMLRDQGPNATLE